MISHLNRNFIKNLSMTRNRMIFTIPQKECVPQKYQIVHTNNETGEVNPIFKPQLLKQQLMSHFPSLIRDLAASVEYVEIPDATQRLRKALEYHIGTGKLRRSYTFIMAYKLIEPEENITPENIRLISILACCIEMFETSGFILDDIMDAAEIRRDLPCWHKLDGIGLTAVNDSMMIYNATHIILRKYFSNHNCYIPILHLFNEVSLKTTLGQSIDNMSNVNGKPNLDVFSMDRYNIMAKFKSSYIGLYLPIVLALYFTGRTDSQTLKAIENITTSLGIYFQVKDDVSDCFGDTKSMRKHNYVDIRQGKCSWLVVKALQKASKAQKRILEECYGKSDEKSIIAVRNLYEELDLQNEFEIYNERTLQQLSEQVRQAGAAFPNELFTSIEQMY